MDARMAKQLQQMQAKMVKAQEELANETVTATAGGGAVTVEMNGHHEVVSVKLDPAAVDPDDVEMLQDMIVAALSDALQKAQDLAQRKMSAITGGLNIPGLF
ncbi:MAG TPA: YbaB/EbfC family nucleoid-associated protein [Chloroflexia bacterium]|jgi:DNA-binding YbaB/EbfC family protein|nr:YbaB/EbfC family nucleoid-associated protein [Chloroflexia bacterium]